LTFSDANFTPYTRWVSGMVDSVRAHPSTVIDCSASNNSTACLSDAAKKFVGRAFRSTAAPSTLTRYADFFTASVCAVGLASATADLVDVTLSSPSFAYRDEVLTDPNGVLQPAQALANLTYTLADAPPEAATPSSAANVGAAFASADDLEK